MLFCRYDDFEWGETLGSGSYGEVVVAVVKPEARSRFPRVEEQISDTDYKVAVKRLSIAFINKEQKIKERTGILCQIISSYQASRLCHVT